MTVKYVIREKSTDTFCKSSRHAAFTYDLQKAVLFTRKETAERAARTMFAAADRGEVNKFGGWVWTTVIDDGTKTGTTVEYHHALLAEYIALLEANQYLHGDDRHQSRIDYLRTKAKEQRCEMEVLAVQLALVE